MTSVNSGQQDKNQPMPSSSKATTGDLPASKKARRGALQSGFSLLARGEPQIWFTGGMLVICIGMVVGLMTLIIVSGLPTFWPQPLDIVVLNDGSLVIGQPQKTRLEAPKISPSISSQDSIADGENLDTSSDEQADEPELQLSRYYRTGNFDLTGEHYRWLESGGTTEAGIVRPESGMVVERLENGRLYGIPLHYSEPIVPSDLTLNLLRSATEASELVKTIADPDSTELANQITTRVDTLAGGIRDRALRDRIVELVDATESDRKATIQYKIDSGVWQTLSASGDSAKVSASDLTAAGVVNLEAPGTSAETNATATDDKQEGSESLVGESLVTEARQIWNHDESLIEMLIEAASRATRLRGQAKRLKYEISRMDERIAKLRAKVRLAEIETELQAAQPVEQSHYYLDQQVRLELRSEELSDAEKTIERLLKDDVSSDASELLEQLKDWFEEYQTQKLPGELAAVEEQLDQWMVPFEEQPEEIRGAVLAYQDGFREVMRNKMPLEQELELVEEELQRGAAEFAIPTNTTVLAGIDSSDIEQLGENSLTDTLLEQLAVNGIPTAEGELSVETLSAGEHLQFYAVTDAQAERHVLAIVEPGYVSSLPEITEEQKVAPERQVLLLQAKTLAAEEMVRTLAVNQLSLGQKVSVYVDRWREFLFEDPREANTEGGVFPAIWGTIVMTLIMTIAVVPFGVMAALYLREYTSSGPLVSIIRISINNLAGVPSIVYGVFGFSFFCYTIGAFIDGGPDNANISPWPSGTWFLAVGAVAIMGTAAFFFSFFGGGPSHTQTTTKKWFSRGALVLWLTSVGLLAVLILKSPFFDGFYREYLPSPTFGKGGLLWAAMTLALLTLPVVIVATEEALSAVPNSLREGSLACGASKWQTIRRIILPHARPGILTGAILAMARGAGEVAPLMLVGALPSAPDLPLDSEYPFFHGSRSFMHLGYQIFTLGFQSQNSEAAKPMVFTCTLLLILIVAVLNVSAIYLRASLRKRFQGNQF